jgi:uncharacterized tellurite resistance protein B-like protein
MHILLAIVAILGGAAFWWWRIKAIGDAASEVTDVAGRAWGKYKRHKFRKKVEDSPLEAVDDAVAAAVVMMLTVAKTDGPMSARADTLIRAITAEDLGADDVTELMTFTTWVATHADDANNISRRYAKLWASALDISERRGFVDMVQRVAEVDGPVSREKQVILAKLRERLGLEA